MSKYEQYAKQLPITGRNGNIKLGAVMDGEWFGWDCLSVRYGLVDGPGMIPEETDKMHTHDYDQMIMFISSDADHMLDLGAELEIDLGPTGIVHKIATPHVITIPKGTPHFSPVVKSVEKPFYFVAVSGAAALKAEVFDETAVPGEGPLSKFFGEFMRNVKVLGCTSTDPYHYGSEHAQPTGGVSHHVGPSTLGMEFTMSWSTIRLPNEFGPWKDDGLHHAHAHQNYEETLMFFSLDQDNLTDLHGVADICIGEEGVDQEHIELTKATATIMHKGVWHLPLVFKEVDYNTPMVFITLSRSSGF
jgi:hypothetical protein